MPPSSRTGCPALGILAEVRASGPTSPVSPGAGQPRSRHGGPLGFWAKAFAWPYTGGHGRQAWRRPGPGCARSRAGGDCFWSLGMPGLLQAAAILILAALLRTESSGSGTRGSKLVVRATGDSGLSVISAAFPFIFFFPIFASSVISESLGTGRAGDAGIASHAAKPSDRCLRVWGSPSLPTPCWGSRLFKRGNSRSNLLFL